MNEYEVTLVIVVKQRGADRSDAANRALHNLRLANGHTFDQPLPFAHSVPAGPTTVSRDPCIVSVRDLQ